MISAQLRLLVRAGSISRAALTGAALAAALSACGATPVEMVDSQDGELASAAVTPAQAASPLYQAYQAYLSRTNTSASAAGLRTLSASQAALAAIPGEETIESYAARCDVATGIHVPSFNCDVGVEVPGQGTVPAGKLCDNPNVLNRQCDPGSKFQVLVKTADAAAVAHCRKVGKPIAGSSYNDIAVIQYNKTNGALCFYQALSNLNGSNVPAPTSGSATFRWISPAGTHTLGCTSCHDNGGFIRSRYLSQLSVQPNVLPSISDGFDNFGTPVRFVGQDYAADRTWSVHTARAIGDTGGPCNSCHRLAVNNRSSIGGTAANFANIATAATQASKSPHGPNSPIWMRPGQTFYVAEAEESASKFRTCATGFWTGMSVGFTSGTPTANCDFSPLAVPWVDYSEWEIVPDGALSSGPAVARGSSSNHVNVFARATDDSYYYNPGFSLDEGLSWSYSGWSPLGGRFLGAPAAVAYGANLKNVAVVGRGTDNTVYIDVCIDDGASCTFQFWTQIPGFVSSFDPTITYQAPYLYVISPKEGTNEAYWTRNDVSAGFDSANWSTWSLIPGGVLNAQPSATVLDGTIYVAARGTNDQYYLTQSNTGSSWTDWASIALGNPTTFTSGPALVSWDGGHLEVFGTIDNNGANELWNNVSPNAGATWGAYVSVGGNLIGGAAVWSPTPGQVQIFGTGTNEPEHRLYQSSNRGR